MEKVSENLIHIQIQEDADHCQKFDTRQFFDF